MEGRKNVHPIHFKLVKEFLPWSINVLEVFYIDIVGIRSEDGRSDTEIDI